LPCGLVLVLSAGHSPRRRLHALLHSSRSDRSGAPRSADHRPRSECGRARVRYADGRDLDRPDGATTNLICFDDVGDHEALLLKRTGRQLDIADNRGRSRTASSSRPLSEHHRWQRMLDEGRFASVRELAEAERVGHSYVGRILRVTLLGPDIVEHILDGRRAPQLADLMQPFPVEWERQREQLRGARSGCSTLMGPERCFTLAHLGAPEKAATRGGAASEWDIANSGRSA